jgi:hypothetical protein
MNGEYVQNLRYKLQKRVRKLNSTEFGRFHISLKHFWGFLEDNPVFIGILQDLGNRCPSAENEADRIINKEPLLGDTELEHAAVSYFLIKKCIESDNDRVELNISYNYNRTGNFDQILESFKDIFLESFYEYLDEQLDDQKVILSLLRRYKHKCEWFQRDYLYNLWENNTSRGEKLLALHLYEYLHDQGLDFTIEPYSISGEADLVAAQNTDDPLIADTKIFNPDRGNGKSYITKGFNQIYVYTMDYNEPFGYLVIYKTSKKDLRFALSNQTQSIPFVIHNNKTIFIITIDIFPHNTSASGRGAIQSIEITEENLINIVDEKK